MKNLWEVIRLYRNDSHVSDAQFELMLIDAIERDYDQFESAHSVKVTPEEFDRMTREPEMASAYAIRASVERGI